MRLRFPPSPTGWLHVGNARAALMNWAWARQAGAGFLLRLEDTDPARSREAYATDLMAQLAWLGLNWDEGPDMGGPVGPYHQAQRANLHREAAQKLLEANLAYWDFATEEEVEAARAAAAKANKPYRYEHESQSLSREEAEAKKAQWAQEGKAPPALRFRMPRKRFSWKDLVKGSMSFSGAELGDFVILRGDASPSYMLAVVADDWAQGVTHVLRGEDHLSNTPRQMALCEALGGTPPTFGHLPLMVGQGGAKLSKRSGSTSLRQMRADGQLPEALANALALTGWSPPEGCPERFSLSELVHHFDPKRLQSAPAFFDPARLNWLGGEFIKALPNDQLRDRLQSYLSERMAAMAHLMAHNGDVEAAEAAAAALPANTTVPPAQGGPSPLVLNSAQAALADPQADEALGMAKEGAATLAELAMALAAFSPGASFRASDLPSAAQEALAHDEAPKALAAGLALVQEAQAEGWGPEALAPRIKALPKALGLPPKVAFMALRVATTGRNHGAELARVWAKLGPDELLRRLNEATALHADCQAEVGARKLAEAVS